MIINLVACTMLQASGKPRVLAPPVRVEQNQRFLLQQNRFEDKQLRNETLVFIGRIISNNQLQGMQKSSKIHTMGYLPTPISGCVRTCLKRCQYMPIISWAMSHISPIPKCFPSNKSQEATHIKKLQRRCSDSEHDSVPPT